MDQEELQRQQSLITSMEASFAKLQASMEQRAALRRCDSSYGRNAASATATSAASTTAASRSPEGTRRRHLTPLYIPLNDAPEYCAPTQVAQSAPSRYRSLAEPLEREFVYKSSAVLSPEMVAFGTPMPTSRSLDLPDDPASRKRLLRGLGAEPPVARRRRQEASCFALGRTLESGAPAGDDGPRGLQPTLF